MKRETAAAAAGTVSFGWWFGPHMCLISLVTWHWQTRYNFLVKHDFLVQLSTSHDILHAACGTRFQRAIVVILYAIVQRGNAKEAGTRKSSPYQTDEEETPAAERGAREPAERHQSQSTRRIWRSNWQRLVKHQRPPVQVGNQRRRLRCSSNF